MDKPVERLWGNFRRLVISDDAPPIQVQEMRRAFFAGVHAILSYMSKEVGPGEDMTEADSVMIREVTTELKEYRNRVLEGRE